MDPEMTVDRPESGWDQPPAVRATRGPSAVTRRQLAGGTRGPLRRAA